MDMRQILPGRSSYIWRKFAPRVPSGRGLGFWTLTNMTVDLRRRSVHTPDRATASKILTLAMEAIQVHEGNSTSHERGVPGPLEIAKSLANQINCTLDTVRINIRPFLPQHRPFMGLAKLQERKLNKQTHRPSQVSFRGSHFAAAIPGDGVVEQVFTSGISSFLNLYNTVLIGRIILTWFPSAPPAIVTPLSTITDPYLNLFRGIIPPLGGTLDLSPILAFVALDLFTNAAAALPCEMDGKPETSQKNPLQMLVPSKAASALRARIARNRRQVLLE